MTTDRPRPVGPRSRTELKLDIQHTREEISATLDALEAKLNVRRRAKDGIADLRRRIRRRRRGRRRGLGRGPRRASLTSRRERSS
jgi:hypothetical protein